MNYSMYKKISFALWTNIYYASGCKPHHTNLERRYISIFHVEHVYNGKAK